MKKALITSVKVGLVTAIIGAAGLGGVKGLDKLEAILQQHPDNYSDRSHEFSQYDTEQLFVTSNPRLSKNYETNGIAYVFVHTGYFESGYFRHGSADQYKEYLNNVRRIIRDVNDSGALVLYLTEVGARRDILELIDDPFIIVTDERNPFAEKYVKTESGKKEQNPDLVYTFLRNNDVKEVRFIGEMAWWGNRSACLGAAAESFHKQGFDIIGVEGGIFPTTPGDNLWFNLDPRGRVEAFYDALGLHKGIPNSQIMDKLYGNPINLN